MKRILAFDYGLRRVGLAVTDPLQIIANSLETVETKNIFTFLKSYLAKETVGDFVVGFPVHYGTSRNEMIPHIEKFMAELKQNFPEITIHKMDERFTSKMASQYSFNETSDIKILIIDLLGNTVALLKDELSAPAGSYSNSYSLKTLSEGMYYVTMIRNGSSTTIPVSVIK